MTPEKIIPFPQPGKRSKKPENETAESVKEQKTPERKEVLGENRSDEKTADFATGDPVLRNAGEFWAGVKRAQEAEDEEARKLENFGDKGNSAAHANEASERQDTDGATPAVLSKDESTQTKNGGERKQA